MARLFPRLPFHPDETPFSWVARLAALHIGGTAGALLLDLGCRPHRLLRGDVTTVRQICDLVGEEADPVLHNLIRHDSAHVFSLRTERFTPAFVLSAGTHFCPLCLLEDENTGNAAAQRRERLSWRLRHVRTCPRHHTSLALRAFKQVGAQDLSCTVPETGAAMEQLARRVVSRAPSALQDYSLNRLQGLPGPAWLDTQTLEQAVRATEMLGMVMRFGAYASPHDLRESDWDLAGREGWEWTSRGETGLREAFAHLQATTPRTIRMNGPGSAFGSLYRWLDLGGHRMDRGPIRRVLREHLLSTLR